jgi:hypothetical protein
MVGLFLGDTFDLRSPDPDKLELECFPFPSSEDKPLVPLLSQVVHYTGWIALGGQSLALIIVHLNLTCYFTTGIACVKLVLENKRIEFAQIN